MFNSNMEISVSSQEIIISSDGNKESENGGSGSISEKLGSAKQRPSSRATSTASSSCASCHFCGYESVRHSNLKRHIKAMHETSTLNRLECCDIVFQDKAEYREHIRVVHREGHECSTCHRIFSRRALLRRHQSVHTGYKEFSCHFCSYASSHKSNLERHLKTHSGLNRKNKSQVKGSQPQPDSTTPSDTTNPVTPNFPILRNILKTNHSSISKYSKPNISHSIESILNRKEVTKKPKFNMNPFHPTDVDDVPTFCTTPGTNQSEFPSSGIPPEEEEKASPMNLSEIKEYNPTFRFTSTLGLLSSQSFEKDLRNTWHPPTLPSYPDLRISSPNYPLLQIQPYYYQHHQYFYTGGLPYWNNNYFYPCYTNNGESNNNKLSFL